MFQTLPNSHRNHPRDIGEEESHGREGPHVVGRDPQASPDVAQRDGCVTVQEGQYVYELVDNSLMGMSGLN